MIKRSINQEDNNNYIYVPNNKGLKYTNSKLTELKGEIEFHDNSCRLQCSLLIMGRTTS